ncbi:class-II fumarase/aspartase family protein [Rothia koreensis]|uniref:class-II fumarase/aspartase family protein n=1 Tax=Rothia koreensis TaxID=592378 RepID=UPI003FCC3AF8
MTSAFDSQLFKNVFGTPDMRKIFGDTGYLERVVATETALARAQAQVGLIPVDAAAAITDRADASQIDLERLRISTENVGYPILDIVEQISAQVGEMGGFVHWGATTQDIMDTATVLQIKDGIDLISYQLDQVRDVLRRQAAEHAETVTAGRTHLQHALPVTFGYRCAVWLSALDRHAERLQQVRQRALKVQFGGAAGTLASLGDRGLDVRQALASELGLGEPEITWHVARDGFVEVVGLLAMIGGSLGKAAYDVTMMASSEFAEVAEPFVEGRGASSTMPQKRNPVSSEIMLAAAKLLRDRHSSMLDAMLQDFERATGPWHVEWVALPEAFLLAGSALSQAFVAFDGLVVDADRMRKNLDATGGLIVAERVMMELAEHVGRQESHHIVYAASQRAIEEGKRLAEVLVDEPRVSEVFDAQEVDQLTDPASYLGTARTMIDRVVTPSADHS